MRRICSLTAAVAVATSTIVATTSPTLADSYKTHQVTYKQVCHAIPDAPPGQPAKNTQDQDVTWTITSKDSVAVGHGFSVRMKVKPGKVDVAKLPLGAKMVSQSRYKMDLELPPGVQFVSADVDDSAANLKGFTVFTVNENGQRDPNGRILRVASAGNSTIGNSPDSSDTSPAPVFYPITSSTVDLKFPTVKLIFKALTPGKKVFGVRHSNGADAFGANAKNYLTFLAIVSTPIGLTIHAPTYCTPRNTPGGPFISTAANLFAVNVTQPQTPSGGSPSTGSVPSTPKPATMGLTTPATAYAGNDFAATATFSAPVKGKVTFTVGSQSQTVDVDGQSATAKLPAGQVAGRTTVAARFTPAPGQQQGPLSSTAQVTVARLATNATSTGLKAQLSGQTIAAGGSIQAITTLVPRTNTSDTRGTLTTTVTGPERKTITTKIASGTQNSIALPATTPGRYSVVVAYKPSTSEQTSATSQTLTYTVTAAAQQPSNPGTADLSTVGLTVAGPDTVKAKVPTVYTITAADLDGVSAGINGTITISNGDKAVVAKGSTAPLKARMINGKARVRLDFRPNGKQALNIVLKDSSGKRIAGVQKLVTVTGGATATPPTQNSGGGFMNTLMSMMSTLFGSAGSSQAN